MCEWMPRSLSSGRASTREQALHRRAVARRARIERPNFWSSCAVEMYSWPPACTPVVTRTITGAGLLARGRVGHPVDLHERVDDDPPDPRVERARDLGVGLVVAVQADVRAGDAGPQRDRELAARGGVDAQALLVHPARDARRRGTPCPRSRRRRPRRSRRTPSRTRAGRRARASAGRPRRGRRRACRARRRASRTSTPADGHDAVGRPGDPGRPGLAGHIRSGARHAEQAEPVGEHLAGGVVEPQARAVHVADLLVAERGSRGAGRTTCGTPPASSSR